MNNHKILDNTIVLYVIVMTLIVSFILSSAQREDVDLEGIQLLLFLFGFIGSIFCILLRFILLFKSITLLDLSIKKTIVLICIILGGIVYITTLVGVFRTTGLSIGHSVYENYNSLLYFNVVILLGQWIVEKI